MEDGDENVGVDQLPMLSLSPPSSHDTNGIDVEPISYCLPPPSSTTVDLSSIHRGGDDGNSTFLSLSLLVSESPSEPTLSLLPEVSENPSGPTLSPFPELSENNTPPQSSSAVPPSTDLCLSLPYTPDSTTSTITTNLHCSIGIQHSSAKRSLFQESGEEKFVPCKKIKVRKNSTANNPKRPRVVVPAAADGEEGHWIIKPLTKSDVNGASRLLLPRQDVKNYVLPLMKEEEQALICNELCGVDVTVYDMDTQTEHVLTLRKWPTTESFQLLKAWRTEFVKRRNLKQGDVIWIRWEKNNYRFCFQVHKRNQVDAV